MADFLAIVEEEANRGVKELLVDTILDNLDEDTRVQVVKVLHDPNVSARAVGRALTRIDHEVSVDSVRKWRVRNGV